MFWQLYRLIILFKCRSWNVDLVLSLIDCLLFLFHLFLFLVVLSRDFFISFYVNCFFHVRDVVIFNLLFQPSGFHETIELSFQAHLWICWFAFLFPIQYLNYYSVNPLKWCPVTQLTLSTSMFLIVSSCLFF